MDPDLAAHRTLPVLAEPVVVSATASSLATLGVEPIGASVQEREWDHPQATPSNELY